MQFLLDNDCSIRVYQPFAVIFQKYFQYIMLAMHYKLNAFITLFTYYANVITTIWPSLMAII